MMRNRTMKRPPFASLALAAALVAMMCSASCGSGKGQGFGDNGGSGSGSASSGTSDGGSGDDSPFGCVTCGNSGVGSLGDGGPAAGPPVGTMTNANIDECGANNPGKLAAQTVTNLEKGGPLDPAMSWLYPYDQTVFPGGILPPLLMWKPQAGGADGVYLHMKSTSFEYKGCFGANPSQQLYVPNGAPNYPWSAAWDHNNGPGDLLTIEITTIAGGKISGPIAEKWTFAKGSLKGVLYYNTYNSGLLGNGMDGGNIQNGAIMQIAPSGASPTLLISIQGLVPFGPCISCHSVNATGSMLVAQRHFYPGGLQTPGSESFNLGAGKPDPANPVASDAMDDWGFSGVYPDGSMLLTSGEPTDSNMNTLGVFPLGTNDNPGMIGVKASAMYDTKTGNSINFTGLGIKYAMMPMFSPDGKHVVFNDYDTGAVGDGGPASGHSGHSLMVMDFDFPTKTFSNPKSVFSDPNQYPGWPFFTPDGNSVIFYLGDSPNFASLHSIPFPLQNSDVAQGDLYVVDVASGKSHPLDQTNGLMNGSSYLPFPNRDPHRMYYPTVSPVPSGGYFWVYFTSRRNYGNRFNTNLWDSSAKKIWVAAIDINAPAGTDPSHPAFYLPGQEDQSGNIRAFAALNPCKADGNSCETGVDCCDGSCDPATNKCGKPMGCALLDNRCNTTADCCNEGGVMLQCVGGVCTQLIR